MAYTSRINWETLRSVNSTAFNGTFQALGAPLVNPSYILKMVNNSNVLVTVSIDGVNAIDVCPANSFWLYDETKYVGTSIQFLPAGTQIFVNGPAPSPTNVGLVYLVTQYIQSN
jgi:hypothetical protein